MRLTLANHLSCLKPALRYLFVLMVIRQVAGDDDGDDKTKITTNFTEPTTGLPMQRFFGAKSGFGFAIAVPDTPSTANATSFIGHMTFPLASGAGWGGWSVTGDMEGPLLMAAWLGPDSASVVSSFRQADNEDDNPPEVTGPFAVRPIAEATSANASFLTYTFLCEGCLSSGFGLGPSQVGGTVEMGWALGSKAVGNPASSAAVLNFHDVGFGGFQAQLGLAGLPQAEFDRVAALAGPPAQAAAGAVPFAGGNGADGGDSDDSDDEDDD